jgi:hypothetical protein
MDKEDITLVDSVDLQAPDVVCQVTSTAGSLIGRAADVIGRDLVYMVIVLEAENGRTHLVTNVEKERIPEFARVMTTDMTPASPRRGEPLQ